MLGQVRDLLVMRKPLRCNELRHRLAAGQLVDLAPDEGVGEGRVAADDRLGERRDGLPDQVVELVGAEAARSPG